jgi:hypothetical protein
LSIESSEKRELRVSAVVADVRELCAQFKRAIAALAADDIATLEVSSAVQQELVGKLQSWFRCQPSAQHSLAKLAAPEFSELTTLTRTYSLLLQAAMRTARLRASLCQTYKQNFPAAPEAVDATGWSCEV